MYIVGRFQFARASFSISESTDGQGDETKREQSDENSHFCCSIDIHLNLSSIIKLAPPLPFNPSVLPTAGSGRVRVMVKAVHWITGP